VGCANYVCRRRAVTMEGGVEVEMCGGRSICNGDILRHSWNGSDIYSQSMHVFFYPRY
jgi:hypothetical protein